VTGKVSGPGSGPPVGGPSDDPKSESPSGVGGARFADKLGAPDAAKPAGGPGAAAAPGTAPATRGPKEIDPKEIGLTADVAAELAAGRINAKAALDRVIERIVDKQLGPGAPEAVRETVRTALERAVADDPVLSEKIRSLANR
jgi:hypothetical protein